MKLLVVDNGDHLASRIGEVLCDLGQEVIVAPDPAHAIELARQLDVDGIFADIDMPDMNGLEFAEMLWLFERYVPLAFRSSRPPGELTAQAAEIGLMFPGDWEAADIERIVHELQERRPRRLAHGSEVTLPPLAPSERGQPARAKPGRDAWLLVPRRKIVHKLRVVCRRWDQVDRLCARHDDGRNQLVVRDLRQLAIGERLLVAFELPNDAELSIAAEVRFIRGQESERVCVIDLIGMSEQICALLRAMARGDPATPDLLDVSEPPGALPARVVTQPMRRQVDHLAAQLDPKTGSGATGNAPPSALTSPRDDRDERPEAVRPRCRLP